METELSEIELNEWINAIEKDFEDQDWQFIFISIDLIVKKNVIYYINNLNERIKLIDCHIEIKKRCYREYKYRIQEILKRVSEKDVENENSY